MRKPTEVISLILTDVLDPRPKEELTPGHKGALIGGMEQVLSTQERHALLMKMFGVESSKEMTVHQWHALMKWANYAEVDGIWLPDQNWYPEMKNMLIFYRVRLEKEPDVMQAAEAIAAPVREAVKPMARGYFQFD